MLDLAEGVAGCSENDTFTLQEENFQIPYTLLLLDIQGLLVSEEFQANRKVFGSIGLNPRRPPRLLDWYRPCRHEILSRIW